MGFILNDECDSVLCQGSIELFDSFSFKCSDCRVSAAQGRFGRIKWLLSGFHTAAYVSSTELAALVNET